MLNTRTGMVSRLTLANSSVCYGKLPALGLESAEVKNSEDHRYDSQRHKPLSWVRRSSLEN